jgi:hypothetical protein
MRSRSGGGQDGPMSHPQWQQPEQPRPISWPGEPVPYPPSQSWPAAQDPYTPTGGQPVPYPQSGPAYGQQTYPPQQPYGYPQYQQPQYGPPPGYPPQAPQQHVAVVQNVRMMTARQGTNHRLHFILTCVTCGLWAPVWFVVWLFGRG